MVLELMQMAAAFLPYLKQLARDLLPQAPAWEAAEAM